MSSDFEASPYYNYDTFTYPVPPGYIIPKGTQVYCVEYAPHRVETFYVTLGDIMVPSSSAKVYYLTYDITASKLPEEVKKPPEEVNSVIYNVRAGRSVYPVAVYQGDMLWAVFSALGKLTALYSSEIKSFDTTPPKKEAGGDDE